MGAAENGGAAQSVPPPTATEVMETGGAGDVVVGENVAPAAPDVVVDEKVAPPAPAAAEVAKDVEVEKKGKEEGEEEKEEKPKTVGTFKLMFKYAKPLDIFYMFLGTVAAIVCG